MPYKDRENLYKAQKRHRLKVRGKLLDFLTTKSCTDCGEKDPIVLEFDHTGKIQKVKDVSRMLSGHYSWESVLKEIDKCEIRCANCHRRKTYIQFGFFGKTKRL
jgi:5-methylcytosine-specific restriction endonuclease McrA